MRLSSTVSCLTKYCSLQWKTYCIPLAFPSQGRWWNQRHFSSQLTEKQAKMMGKGLPKKKRIEGVKNIVLVASGKGGVGKSTTSVNLAVALASPPCQMKVGLLDADVFGPSVPLMMNVNDSPELTKDNKMIPLLNYGVKCMSMGFLVEESSAVIWRGLMVMSALNRLLHQVDWGELDVLVIDTPPGTGDTLLSLLQNLIIDGVLVVSTPQKAALSVARRGITMLQKLDVPIIGLTQNMGKILCPKCDTSIEPFGNGTQRLAADLGIPFLVDIPLDPKISEASDSGAPLVITQPSSLPAQCYTNLANKVADFIKAKKETIQTKTD